MINNNDDDNLKTDQPVFNLH